MEPVGYSAFFGASRTFGRGIYQGGKSSFFGFFTILLEKSSRVCYYLDIVEERICEMRWRRMKTMKKTSMDAYCAIQTLFVPASLRQSVLSRAPVRHDSLSLFVSLQTEEKGVCANEVSASRAEVIQSSSLLALGTVASEKYSAHPAKSGFLSLPRPLATVQGGFFVPQRTIPSSRHLPFDSEYNCFRFFKLLK